MSVSGTVHCWCYFLEVLACIAQSNKRIHISTFVTSSWLRNIYLIPIDYDFRPRLRGRLTLRGLPLHRNPWTYGGSVSHTPLRYSCQHSHFRYLQPLLRVTFTGLRNAPLPLQRTENRGQRSESSVQKRKRLQLCNSSCCLFRYIFIKTIKHF